MTSTTAPPTTPAQVLARTADWFAKDPTRWGQQWFRDPKTGCRCAMGGLARVLDPDQDGMNTGDPSYVGEIGSPQRRLARDTVDRFARYLVMYLDAPEAIDYERPGDDRDPGVFNPVETVGEWNDRTGRTVGEVIAALRAAAAWAGGAR